MPPRTGEKIYDLSHFAPLLDQVQRAGFEMAVVGGCAVGAYGRLAGAPTLSGDLDLYMEPRAISGFIDWAVAEGLQLVHRPMPRALQTAMFLWRGVYVDVLVEALGMPGPTVVLGRVREFVLKDADGLVVPVADPYDLLANKLAVRREKDLPHIDILRRFIEAEVVASFADEEGRHRIEPARRLMDVLGTTILPEPLAARMLPESRDALGRRFLAGTSPTAEQVRAVIAQAPDAGEAELLQAILARRAF